MGLGESFIKNVFCDIVKPRIGSVVKIALKCGADHTGIYIGNNQIVEVANINDVATVRIVSAEEFIEGMDCFTRLGTFIYVACKQDQNGNCIAMGSKDIAVRAKVAVGQTSIYSLLFNNCHMFTQYCITGEKNDCSPFLAGVEVALDNKFIEHDNERLLDMWRSTGESRGSNPYFVDNDQNKEDRESVQKEYDRLLYDDAYIFENNLIKAELGDAEACYQIGRSYFAGIGIKSNSEKAAEWYGKAAQKGHVEAMYEFAECYYLGSGLEVDEKEAKKWYQRAAEAGDESAKERLKDHFD